MASHIESDVEAMIGIRIVGGEDKDYTFYAREQDRRELLRLLGALAASPQFDFTWYDAALLSQHVRRMEVLSKVDDSIHDSGSVSLVPHNGTAMLKVACSEPDEDMTFFARLEERKELEELLRKTLSLRVCDQLCSQMNELQKGIMNFVGSTLSEKL